MLTLRTVKADGTTREPEEIAEKQTISVPDLEPGDYVEFEYVDPAAPPGAFPRGFLAERFFFRSFDAPLYRTEYVLVDAARHEAADRSRAATAPRDARRAARRRSDVTRSGRPRQAAAVPGAGGGAVRRVPAVGARGGGAVVRRRGRTTCATRSSARAPTASCAWLARGSAQEAVARETGARDRRLGAPAHQAAAGALDEAGHLDPGARARATASRSSARSCAAAGVPSEIWLARPPSATRSSTARCPTSRLRRAALAGRRRGCALDPRYRHAPTGLHHAAVARRRGAARWSPAAGTRGRVSRRAIPTTAAWSFDVAPRARRLGRGAVREKLRGWPAARVARGAREARARPRARRVRAAHARLLLPGRHAGRICVGRARTTTPGRSVVYKFRAPQLARKWATAGPARAVPGDARQRYVGVATRTHAALELDYASPTELSARVAVPPGVQVEVPPAAKADGFGQFEQTAAETAAGIELKARFAMPRTRVPPDRYRDFVDFATGRPRRSPRRRDRPRQVASPGMNGGSLRPCQNRPI